MFKFAVLLLLLSVHKGTTYFQNDYKLIHHRVEVDKVNPKFLEFLNVSNVKFNRTTRAFSALMKVEIDIERVHITVQAYKFLNNEYKKFPALRFSVNGCDALKNNLFNSKELTNKSGNYTQCPIKKGGYYIKDFVPGDDSLPPLIPSGDYKVEIITIILKEEAAVISWYGSIQKRN